MAEVVAGIRIPDSKLAREATDLLREHGSPLLLAHSLMYLFGAIRGRHRKLTADHELLYFGGSSRTADSPRSTAARTTGSRSMGRTRRGTSCGPMASTNRRPRYAPGARSTGWAAVARIATTRTSSELIKTAD
jgi:hypothetical protein